MDALIEFADGCVANQVAIFDEKVVDDLNFILRNHVYADCRHYQVHSFYFNGGAFYCMKVLNVDRVTAGGASQIEQCGVVISIA
jgi:hypothetical protein